MQRAARLRMDLFVRRDWLERDWVRVAGLFLATRLAFYGIAFFALWLLPPARSEPAAVDVNSGWLVALHWRWDAVHYYTIATHGYTPWGLSAFFPLFPLLLRLGATLLGLHVPAAVPIDQAERWPLVLGIGISQLALLGALWCVYQLARADDADQPTAERALLYIACFPLAFYYNLPYTEALFLFLTAATFLATRRGRWVWAGLAAAAAGATRPVGGLMVLVLLVELWLAWRAGALRSWWRAVVGLLLAPTGVLGYMAYLGWRFNDPLAFIHAQQQSDWVRTESGPLQTLRSGLHYALHPELSHTPAIHARGVLHLVIVLVFLALTLLSLRRWRSSYLVYSLGMFAVILASPFPDDYVMHGLGRYVMVLFPVYFTLARWGRWRWVHYAILSLWLPLYGLLSALYIGWYPVA